MKNLEEIKRLRDSGADTDTVISELSEYIAASPEDDEALTMRGMAYWSKVSAATPSTTILPQSR